MDALRKYETNKIAFNFSLNKNLIMKFVDET